MHANTFRTSDFTTGYDKIFHKVTKKISQNDKIFFIK